MHYLDIELDGIDENGNKKTYKLNDFNGKYSVIYFYPEDDTPVCTKEAHDFRDALTKLKKYANIIGVSHNDIDEHIDFQSKHNLNFILISDKNNKLKQAFIEHNDNLSDIKRSTFVLDKDGNIVKAWGKVDVEDHIENIFAFFENLENQI